jgi:hypothetical protein
MSADPSPRLINVMDASRDQSAKKADSSSKVITPSAADINSQQVTRAPVPDFQAPLNRLASHETLKTSSQSQIQQHCSVTPSKRTASGSLVPQSSSSEAQVPLLTGQGMSKSPNKSERSHRDPEIKNHGTISAGNAPQTRSNGLDPFFQAPKTTIAKQSSFTNDLSELVKTVQTQIERLWNYEAWSHIIPKVLQNLHNHLKFVHMQLDAILGFSKRYLQS